METALKIQRDIRNNNQDLQNYMLDLNNWEEEMKQKELSLNNERPRETSVPPPRNKIKRSKPAGEKSYSNKPKKISAYDYSAWDKFDVEKACAELDEEDDKEKEEDEEEEEDSENGPEVKEEGNSDESKKNLSLIDEAFYEKELGNQFVKKEQWADAIKCYTNAINLDSKNAIYYANRSLCFLKMRNFKAAEVDATVAIQLDKNYVKAYQRRAFTRLALGQLQEAKSDYEEVLRIEPKNALARVEINKIDEKLKKDQVVSKPEEKKTFNPKEIFKSCKSKPTPVAGTEKQVAEKKLPSASNSKNVEKKARSVNTVVNKPELSQKKDGVEKVEKGDGDKGSSGSANKSKSEIFKPLPEWCKIVHPINIPPHKRSKKPLKRIEIIEVDTDEDLTVAPQPETLQKNDDSVKESSVVHKLKQDDSYIKERLSFDVPQTSIQFQNCWKIIKRNPEEAYAYIKKIPGKQLPEIFENSLESDFFSELLTFLADDTVKKDPEVINDYLVGLSRVKRFSSLILFMSASDKNCVKKCITEIGKIKSKEETSDLYRLYEMEVDII